MHEHDSNERVNGECSEKFFCNPSHIVDTCRFKAQKQPASNSGASSRRGSAQPASGEGVDK